MNPKHRATLVDILIDLDFLGRGAQGSDKYMIRRIRKNLVSMLPKGKLTKAEGLLFLSRAHPDYMEEDYED